MPNLCLLLLQVIGEAILSLPPEECDRVFPALYLPVMEEANHRVLRPYRSYLPTPEWWRFRSNMASLNKYLVRSGCIVLGLRGTGTQVLCMLASRPWRQPALNLPPSFASRLCSQFPPIHPIHPHPPPSPHRST